MDLEPPDRKLRAQGQQACDLVLFLLGGFVGDEGICRVHMAFSRIFACQEFM